MDKGLQNVIQGGLGYFWVSLDTRIEELSDEDARSGFIRKADDALEVHLLQDDSVPFFHEDRDSFPVGILGATEHSGAMLLDLFGWSGTRSFGGSRASVERFKGQTLVVHPSIADVESTLVTSASAYFLGNALLAWADFDAFEQDTLTDDAGRVQAATIQLKPTPDLLVSLSSSIDLRISGHWSLGGDEDLRHVVETALEIEVKSSRPTSSFDLIRPLLRCQELLSLGFHGFVRADAGRAGCTGLDERGHLWNALLMPDPFTGFYACEKSGHGNQLGASGRRQGKPVGGSCSGPVPREHL